MLFADDATREAAKEAVKSAIDVQFWTVTIWVILGAMVTGAGGVALIAIAVYQKIAIAIRGVQSALQRDIKENTEAQATILPAVVEKVQKVDSAVKEATDAKDEAVASKDQAKIFIDTAAVKIGTVIGKEIGKQVGADAKLAAIGVAEHLAAEVKDSKAASKEISDGVGEIRESLNGVLARKVELAHAAGVAEGENRIRGQVEANTQWIAKAEDRIGKIETNTSKILAILTPSTRIAETDK